jgi:hypothetical protein
MKFYGPRYVEEKKNGGARPLGGIVEQIKNVHIVPFIRIRKRPLLMKCVLLTKFE